MDSEGTIATLCKTDSLRRIRHRDVGSGQIHKFMQTIGPEMFQELERIAEEKGIHIQTLLRAVIIPEWIQKKRRLDA